MHCTFNTLNSASKDNTEVSIDRGLLTSAPTLKNTLQKARVVLKTYSFFELVRINNFFKSRKNWVCFVAWPHSFLHCGTAGGEYSPGKQLTVPIGHPYTSRP